MPLSTAPPIVVAIDFGTSRSAWAYSIKGEADDNIIVKIPKGARHTGSSTMKTETAALVSFGLNAACTSFGSAALDACFRAEEDGVEQEGALFRWFKRELCENKGFHSINSPMVEAINGTKGARVPLIRVMTASLRYCKDDILAFLSSISGNRIFAEDVSWVLTVPAIYDDFAKRFMRNAAHKAGIVDKVDSPKLRLCLEPEAACLAVTVDDKTITCEAEGKQMMIIDCGGGTVDITTHKIISTSPLQLAEVLAPTGGHWGSTKVDDAFKAWMKLFLGNALYTTIQKEAPATFLSIMKDWELGKTEFKGSDSGKLRLNLLQLHAINVTTDAIQGLRAGYNATRYSDDHVSGKNYMVLLPSRLVSTFFAPTINSIVRCLHNLRNSPELHSLYRVFLVGGFSSCPLVEQTARDAFEHSGCTVEATNLPEVAIVRGAVMFASMSAVFNSRKARLTYGVSVNGRYDSNDAEHRRRRTAESVFAGDDGAERIGGFFDSHVVVGEDVPVEGVCARRTYTPIKASHTTNTLSIYASTKKNPRFVDESDCFELGSVTVPLDMSVPFEERGCRAQLTLGGTELLVVIFHKTKEEQIDEVLITVSQPPPPP